MFNKNATRKTIGSIISLEGEKFIVFSEVPKYSKHIKKLAEKDKAEIKPEIIIENAGKMVRPYEIVKEHLDLSKSTQTVNEMFIEYLHTPLFINECIRKSILPLSALHFIAENDQYKDDSTFETIAVYQNVMDDYFIRDRFSFTDTLNLFLKNRHRTEDNMKSHRKEYIDIMKELMKEENFEFIKDNPSEIRNLIVKTNEKFYGDIPFLKERNEAIDVLEAKISKLFISKKGFDYIEKKCYSFILNDEDEKLIKDDIYKTAKHNIERINKNISDLENKINILKHFPS